MALKPLPSVEFQLKQPTSQVQRRTLTPPQEAGHLSRLQWPQRDKLGFCWCRFSPMLHCVPPAWYPHTLRTKGEKWAHREEGFS